MLVARHDDDNISHIVNKIFNTIKKPKIYVIYVDDIFIDKQSHNKINKLKQTLEKKCTKVPYWTQH